MLKQLGIPYPIFQAPMAGMTTAKFVAACAQAGIVGSIGAGYLNERETRTLIQEVKQLTKQPFMVNLFVPEVCEVEEAVIHKANAALMPFRKALNLPQPTIVQVESFFEQQIEVIVDEEVAICSFTFGLPKKEIVDRLKTRGIFVIGTATTKEEAHLAANIGMDAVVAQGSEAGGHRGTFHETGIDLPLDQLVTEILEVVDIPVIAAGGIAEKVHMERLMTLGAAAIQIGTALLVADESGAHPLHKEEILRAKRGATVLTKAFSGKWARGLNNEFIEQMGNAFIAPYPIQHTLTKKIRAMAAEKGKSSYMSLWAGERAHMSTNGSVQEIINRFL